MDGKLHAFEWMLSLISLDFVRQAGFAKGDDDITKLRQLEKISSLLILTESEDSETIVGCGETTDCEENICCICYSSKADAHFLPCSHVSCFGCISRHLLNCQRCFFCNATVTEVIRTEENTTT